MIVHKSAGLNMRYKDAWAVDLTDSHVYEFDDEGDKNSEVYKLRRQLAEAEVREDILLWTAKVFLITKTVVPDSRSHGFGIPEAIKIVRQALDELYDFIGWTSCELEEQFLVNGNFKLDGNDEVVDGWGDLNLINYLGALKDELLDALTSLIQIPTPTPKPKEESAND